MKSWGPVILFSLFSALTTSLFSQENKEYKIITLAFYNLENLFDTIDDPLTFDDERTPKGKDHWTEEIYREKIKNMAFAISQIGLEKTGNPPVLLGICEVENQKVLEDLVTHPFLAERNYGVIHYDSPDRRGIDVGLLYQKDFFIPKHSKTHELVLFDSREPEKRVFTRDQLVVSGFLDGEEVAVLVNHWPSRYGGVSRSSYKREQAAALNRKIIDSLLFQDPYAKIISMGDFNDDPSAKSLRKVLGALGEKEKVDLKGMYNPMASLAKTGIGSLAYRDGWNLFDQIMISRSLLEKNFTTYRFFQAGVFNANFLVTPTGQYKGYPFRSFGFGGYTGGYSDHFPVYLFLIKESNRKNGDLTETN